MNDDNVVSFDQIAGRLLDGVLRRVASVLSGVSDLLHSLGDRAGFGLLVAEKLKRYKGGDCQSDNDEERHANLASALRAAIDHVPQRFNRDIPAVDDSAILDVVAATLATPPRPDLPRGLHEMP